MSTDPAPSHKSAFLSTCLSASVIRFGSFELKSKRLSPYFFNAGLFHRALLLRAISTAYSLTILAHLTSHPDFAFDVLFGPAYKGIPLATSTLEKLAEADEKRFGDVSYAFNRKEVKDHGEGGSIVGAPLRGKRVLVVDDVITAGTAIREAVTVIEREGGVLVGVVLAFDRMERTGGVDAENGGKSAIAQVREMYKVPVLAILTLADVIGWVKERGERDQLAALEKYREEYGASD
ncbi:MAG: orotate phosphoribosyltransferase [Vezdaea acicularis]|nr:MAG: orotate phosphoribosyltransferase [Vezdaea acicularis]